MNFLQEHNRVILCASFAVSTNLMIVDLVMNFHGKVFFYAITNAVLVFRLFGGGQIPNFIHVMICVAVGCMLIIYRDNYQTYVFLFLVIPLIVHMVSSAYYVGLYRTKSRTNKARRVGLHAYIGFMIVVVWFWVHGFVMKGTDSNCILSMFYMLMFLFMMLTPYFQTDTQAVRIAEIAARERQERARNAATQADQYPPVPQRASPRQTGGGGQQLQELEDVRVDSPDREPYHEPYREPMPARYGRTSWHRSGTHNKSREWGSGES